MTIKMREFDIEVNDYAGEDARLADGRLVAYDYVVQALPGRATDGWTCPSWGTLERIAHEEVQSAHMDHPYVVERHVVEDEGEQLMYVTLSILERNDA